MKTYIPNQTQLIAEGGEGKIYRYNNNSLIKIFKDTTNKPEKIRKIKQLITMTFPPSIIAPLELVSNQQQQLSGYVMKYIQGHELRRLCVRKFVVTNNITKKDILRMLIDIQDTLKALHAQKIYIGDLNDMNLLFDSKLQVYFIDVDSWTFSSYQGTVINDAFKDPQLIHNHFNANTDWYAFAVLCYKLLTRLHPFGGIYQEDSTMTLPFRIQNGITVINNNKVIIPKMVDTDVFMPTELLEELNHIFTSNDRHPLKLKSFYNELRECSTHHDYYYGKYNTCPVCDGNAQERTDFVSLDSVNGIPLRIFFTHPKIKILFDTNTYLDTNDIIQFRNTAQIFTYEAGCYYYTNSRGDVFYQIFPDKIHITTPKKQSIELCRKERSVFRVINNDIYYISPNLTLLQFHVLENGATYQKAIEHVDINHCFNIHNIHTYFICNNYDTQKLINISGYTYTLDIQKRIITHTIKYDSQTNTWLFIFKTEQNLFYTYIFEKTHGILYAQNDIHYLDNLQNMDYHNGLIYKPKDGGITRFNWKTNEYKEFQIEIIQSDTKIKKMDNKIMALTPNHIYILG